MNIAVSLLKRQKPSKKDKMKSISFVKLLPSVGYSHIVTPNRGNNIQDREEEQQQAKNGNWQNELGSHGSN